MTDAQPGRTRADADRRLQSVRVMHVFGGRVRSGVETFVLTLAAVQRKVLGEVILTPLADGPFVEAIRSLIHDKDMARRFGQAGRVVAEREFSTDALARNVQSVYASLL